MSGAPERGGTTALRATSALQSSHDLNVQPSLPKNINAPRNRNAYNKSQQSSNSSRQQMKLTNREKSGGAFSSGEENNSRESRSTNPFPSAGAVARSELLKDAVFPSWKDDTGSDANESPEEMQKKDPLGTQIWKLYSRTKTRLPNQERMENLTWRMMAMNLKRLEREQQALYVLQLHQRKKN